MDKVWDTQKSEYVEVPEKLRDFYKELESLCEKYDYSISHEDGQGAFIIEEYDEFNIKALKRSHLRL